MTPSRTIDGQNFWYSCREPGYYSRNCPNQRGNNSQNNASFLSAHAISPEVDSYNNRLMFVNVKINEQPIKALVDTGSEITMISDKLAKDLGLTVSKYTGRQITGVNSQPVEITGETQVEVVVSDEFNERSISITAVTIRNFHLNFLLGYDFHFISKSLIDIFNNNIIFNAMALKNDAKVSDNKELIKRD
jgi:hypothetical protein